MSVFDIEVGYSKDFLINLWEKGEGVVTLSGIYRRKDGLTFPAEIRAGQGFDQVELLEDVTVHIDIAGPFWSDSGHAVYASKGGTGYGVDLALRFLEMLRSRKKRR